MYKKVIMFSILKIIFKTYKNRFDFQKNMELTFLGTSCMVPTKERNHQSLFILHNEEGFLVDCGEGTQRQFKIAGIKPSKITKIFISHWHGDHVFGLPGLLQTLNASDYDKKLEIYGPQGTKKRLKLLFETYSLRVMFPLKIFEINNSKVELKEIIVESKELKHSVPCLGYSFVEKDRRRINTSYIKKVGVPEGPLLGKLQNNKSIKWKNKKITPEQATYVVPCKKIAVILDTLPCKNSVKLAENSDVLVAEAVYDSSLLKKAKENKHMTAKQAAEIASKSKSVKLIITHFSQRYKTPSLLLKEARAVFKNTEASKDFMNIKI